jgi:hypothetical protein
MGYPTNYYKFKRIVVGKDIIDCGLFYNAIRMA